MNRPVRRVCVIGNSFVGALRRAYADRQLTEGFEFSFFANGGDSFRRLTFEGPRLTGYFKHFGASPDMRDYDYFLVYADAPMPMDRLDVERGLSTGRFSAQVRAAALRGWRDQFHSFAIVSSLHAISDKPILLHSGNVHIDENVGSLADNQAAAAFMEAMIAPAIYVSFPSEIFLPDGSPDLKFYTGSLDILGQEPDREKLPAHHTVHLNLAGGTLVLKNILAKLSELDAARA